VDLGRFGARAGLVGLMVTSVGVVCAQSYPSKPIRILTAAAGGGSDLNSRLIAQGISGPLGQQVLVDNRAGSGVIPAQALMQAAPDGYTLLLYGSTIWLLPFLQANVPYDPVRDFSPVTWTTTSPNLLVVHPSMPAKSVKELIELAKRHPGELNAGGALPGSTTHIALELFKSMAGIKVVTIPFNGNGPTMTALLAGEVQFMFAASGVAPHIKSGRLKALAVTSSEQSTLYPNLPTVRSTGLPGYELISIDGIFAPAKTPTGIISRLNEEIVRFLNTSEAKASFLNVGCEIVGSSPGEFGDKVKSEMAKWGKVINDAGIKGS
jgi:tripartite-type tricarboxylate transporter receptor subunit TctC